MYMAHRIVATPLKVLDMPVMVGTTNVGERVWLQRAVTHCKNSQCISV